MSHFIYHMSYVTCHMSCVTIFLFGLSGGASWWRVCYQQDIPRLVFFYFTSYYYYYSEVKLINHKKILTEKLWQVSEFALSAQKMVKIYKQKQKLVYTTHCWWVLVKISSSILLYIVGELAGGWSMAVAVWVSDMWQVTQKPNFDFFKFAVLLSLHVERFSIAGFFI